jgi:hypothetical protein
MKQSEKIDPDKKNSVLEITTHHQVCFGEQEFLNAIKQPFLSFPIIPNQFVDQFYICARPCYRKRARAICERAGVCARA